MAMTDLPAFKGTFEHVLSHHEGGEWHFDGNFADGDLQIIDGKYHILSHPFQQQAPFLTGVSYLSRPYNGDPFHWAGYPVSGGIFNPNIAIPQDAHATNGNNVDTGVIVRNPLTGLYTVLYGAEPGEAGEYAGDRNTVQRATSMTPGPLDSDWTRYDGEQIIQSDEDAPWTLPAPQNSTPPITYVGGNLEPSVVADPEIASMVVFWEAHTEEPESPLFGDTNRHRLGRAVCPFDEWDSTPSTSLEWTPAPAADSYVFSPELHGMKAGVPYGNTNETAVWGTMHTPLQSHVSRNPWDGSYHMVCLNKRPNTVAGVENASSGIGHWWSHDRGLTWHADSRNPLVTWDTLGFTNLSEANKLNSTFLLWDKQGRKAWLMFWANDDGMYNDGTKLYGIELALVFGSGLSSHVTGPKQALLAHHRRRIEWERRETVKVFTGKGHKGGVLYTPTGARLLAKPTGGRHKVPPKPVLTPKKGGPHGASPKLVLKPRKGSGPHQVEPRILSVPTTPHRKGAKKVLKQGHAAGITTPKKVSSGQSAVRRQGKPRGGPKKRIYKR